MYIPLQSPFGSGLAESVGQLATVAGSVILLLMLVAMGGFAYKSLRGDGIEWPDETEQEELEEDGELRESHSDDDEWKYY
jgi:hypothetical protein